MKALPKTIKDHLLAIMGGVKGARWQNRDQLHITLKFIGDVDHHQLADIKATLAQIRFDNFQVEIKGTDFFGKGRAPRLIWAGLAINEPPSLLHEKINQALKPLGIPEETRKYLPHITLARLKHLRHIKIGNFMEATAGLRLEPFMAGEFCLYQSHLGHEGALYKVLERFALD